MKAALSAIIAISAIRIIIRTKSLQKRREMLNKDKSSRPGPQNQPNRRIDNRLFSPTQMSHNAYFKTLQACTKKDLAEPHKIALLPNLSEPDSMRLFTGRGPVTVCYGVARLKSRRESDANEIEVKELFVRAAKAQNLLYRGRSVKSPRERSNFFRFDFSLV